MLQEFTEVSQSKDSFRRLFYDNFFDLFVWYKRKRGEIIGFQLCYDKENGERSLIWKANLGYIHGNIDNGENRPGRSKQSPVLVQDGILDNITLAKKFKQNSNHLEKEIFDLVYTQIVGYTKEQENPLL